MSYRCGIAPSLAAVMGTEPGGPRITCDGCGLVYRLPENRPPPAWFLDGEAVPGWAMTRTEDKRDDRCKRCRPAKKSVSP